jgi:hypothetical protein
MSKLSLLAIVSSLLVAACSGASAPPRPVAVAPAPPPRDDGKPAKGGEGGTMHAAALEQLKRSPLGPRSDKQNSMQIMLPDAEHWMRVKFWGVPSLVGFRYGKDHHAVVGAYVTHVDDNTVPGACNKSFEDWAQPLVEMFDVELDSEPLRTMPWGDRKTMDLAVILAHTATLAMQDSYAVTYAVYPAWKNACLVVGAAVPARDEDQRALDVRDRFARDILPKLVVLTTEEPKERY